MNLASIGPRAGCAVALAVLTGCTSIPADSGRGDVNDWVRARGRVLAPSVDQDVASLVRDALRQPLTADEAVRIALLQNPGLRATYARLGLASADLYEAGRLSNPRLSASLLKSSVSGERLTLGLAQSFADLLLLPTRSRLGIAQFTQVKQDVAHDVLSLAARVEQSHYRLVGAQQIAAMRELTATAAAASAELAQRLQGAGNIKQLELARERAAASEARLAALAAQSEVMAARSAHARILGLQPETQWSVESALAAPLAAEEDVETLVALARTSRLDLAAARGRIQSMTDAERSARRSRWFGNVDVGVEREREPDGERLTGPTLALELPVFNLRAGAAMRAAGELERSRAELAGLELERRARGASGARPHARCAGQGGGVSRRADPGARGDRRAHSGGAELHARRTVRAAGGETGGVRRVWGLPRKRA